MCAMLAVLPVPNPSPAELGAIADAVEQVMLAVQDGDHEAARTSWSKAEPAVAMVLDAAIISVPEVARRLATASARAGRLLRDEPAPDDGEAAVDELEIVLECVAAYEDGRATGADRSPAELVDWLAASIGTSQAGTAALLRVSLRTLQRWMRGETRVSAGDQVRIRRLAGAVSDMLHVLTPAGVVAWLARPTPLLDGGIPLDLVHSDDEAAARRLGELVATLRYG